MVIDSCQIPQIERKQIQEPILIKTKFTDHLKNGREVIVTKTTKLCPSRQTEMIKMLLMRQYFAPNLIENHHSPIWELYP